MKSEGADSFWVQVADAEPFVWHTDEALTWDDQLVRVTGTRDAAEFRLEPNRTVWVRFYARDSGTLLDRLMLEELPVDYPSYPSVPNNN